MCSRCLCCNYCRPRFLVPLRVCSMCSMHTSSSDGVMAQVSLQIYTIERWCRNRPLQHQLSCDLSSNSSCMAQNPRPHGDAVTIPQRTVSKALPGSRSITHPCGLLLLRCSCTSEYTLDVYLKANATTAEARLPPIQVTPLSYLL